MSELDSHSDATNKDLNQMFPGWAFIRRHFVEIAALAIPLIGTVGFAAGTSFVDGWNKAAGISTNLFPVGVNEAIFLGLKLERPWQYSGGLIASVLAYLYLTEMFSEWDRAKWGRENLLRRWKRAKRAKNARAARKVAGFHERLIEQSHKEWKQLGPRHRWGQERKTGWRHKRWARFSVRAAALILFLMAIGISLLFIFFLKASIIGESHAEGVRAYVQLYSAITGKLPLNIEDKLSEARLREFACLGRERLWEYRSVVLSARDEGEEKSQAYIVHSTDKLFFIIDERGSSLRSYGDEAFNFREVSKRPFSAIAKQCKPITIQK